MNLRKSSVSDEAPAAGAPSGDRKTLLIAGGVAAGLAVVAAMSSFLLSGGDDDLTSAAPPASAAASRIAAAPTDTATAAPTIKKYTGKSARDPFKALVVAQQAAAVPG